MKNVTYLGLCWATTLALVAAALGQQQQRYDVATPPAPASGQATSQSAPGQNATQPPDSQAPQSGADQKAAMPAPNAPQSGQAATAGAQQRGELGVWLVENSGPGVEIQRITRGSAAEKAGLREGDVILQVNGQGASSPQGAAQIIRQIPIGKSGTLTIWRDGNQKQVQITMQTAREKNNGLEREMGRETNRDSYQVGFRGEEGAANGDSASRMMRLEQQINTLTQELHQLRQELGQLRSAGSVQQTGFNTETTQATTPQSTSQPAPPAAPNATSPPPGFGQPEEKPAKPAAEPAKPATPPAPAAEKPATPPPAAEKSSGTDLFGSEPTKKEEKPKSDKDTKGNEKGSGDDLFK